ncbi:MAG: zinc-ribbon domain-containing protein [Dehalococcoidia bacterium]|nr:zinc-ribbon domain-containing protein [Dehalococcoidia bacterium]MDH4299621.1 zinc-ribbon domain-containing protein [Dehalococcoidia bacterium]MDH4366822.1 zinc-ribbon domain-containing protein [Dehalococcoidia bacterium]
MALCPKCGKEVGEGSTFCPHCGGRLGVGVTPDNTSGQGESAIVPEQVKGWNWGAFSLTWIWGIFSQVWIAFLVFIPFPLFGLAWAIVLGVKGNEWAWRNKKWHSIEHFKSTQRPWNIAGIVLFAISMVALIVVIPAVLIPMFLFW